MNSFWPVPFILDPQHLAIDAVVSFIVSVLLAVTINAEGQAFMATFLGDARSGDPNRFNFNAFLHLSLLGSRCFLVAGFGWPRQVEIDRSKFEHPRLYTVLTRLAGPIANVLMGSIAGSIVYFMKILDSNPRVFMMVIGVNLTVAVYNLIPLPPLAGGALVTELIPPGLTGLRQIFRLAGPFLILALAMLDRLNPPGIISPYLNPLVLAINNYLLGM